MLQDQTLCPNKKRKLDKLSHFKVLMTKYQVYVKMDNIVNIANFGTQISINIKIFSYFSDPILVEVGNKGNTQ